MYQDSIQELNNLIGELDSFQREHELKMKQKHHDKQTQQKQPNLFANGLDIHNTTADTTLASSSIGDISDIYNNFDKLSISSSDPNPLMCSTTTHSSEMTFGSDAADRLNDLTDCQATTMSLKLNLSTTEHPLIMHNNSNSVNGVNGTSTSSTASNSSTVVRNIELIPESYNVSDDYVKEHTEIVVLRRKGSLSDLPYALECNSNAHTQNVQATGKEVERISSFRCSSFSKTDQTHQNDNVLTLKRTESIHSADSLQAANRYKAIEQNNGTHMRLHYDQDVVDHAHNDNETTQMVRQKPIITPRPASLSGLF